MPSATASTRSASPLRSSGGDELGAVARVVGDREPAEHVARRTSARLATYRVRPDSRTWLGAGSPSAAATSAGAASWLLDSTVQSRKNPVM